MKNWMDELENAADKLQTAGKKVIKEASEEFEKVRPVLTEKFEDAKEVYRKKAKPLIEDGLDKAADSLHAAYEKTRPTIEEGMDKAVQGAKTAYSKAAEYLTTLRAEDVDFAPVQKEEPELTQEEEIDLEVKKRMEQIRSASEKSNTISDFIRNKYGKNE